MRYTELRYGNYFKARPEIARRTVDRLRALRAYLDHEVPPRDLERTLLLATWNIRDFGTDKFGHGWRTPEANYYLAQIISAFDIVALQEIGDDLKVFRELEEMLGPTWEFVVTDTNSVSGGNNERMCFVYDTRKVEFRNMAGEVVLGKGGEIGGFPRTVTLPAGTQIAGSDGKFTKLAEGTRLRLPKGQELVDQRQFARTPFVASFQSAWFKFNLCTVHLYYGGGSGEKLQRRIQEIDRVAGFFADRQTRQLKKYGEKENYILLGDFNITSQDDATMAPLKTYKYQIPAGIIGNSNMLRTHPYDQIAFRVRENEVELAPEISHPSSGILDFYQVVYRASEQDGMKAAFASPESDFEQYRSQLPADKIAGMSDAEIRKYYALTWRTWQMSDHLPKWVALKVDFTDDYLGRIDREARKRMDQPN